MKKQAEARDWPINEKLTETEGRIIEATRVWRQAETDAKLWADLEIQEVIVELLSTAREGKQPLLDEGVQMGLTAKEIVALQTVAKFWKREAKRNRQDDKARRKAERVEQSQTAV